MSQVLPAWLLSSMLVRLCNCYNCKGLFLCLKSFWAVKIITSEHHVRLCSWQEAAELKQCSSFRDNARHPEEVCEMLRLFRLLPWNPFQINSNTFLNRCLLSSLSQHFWNYKRWSLFQDISDGNAFSPFLISGVFVQCPSPVVLCVRYVHTYKAPVGECVLQ